MALDVPDEVTGPSPPSLAGVEDQRQRELVRRRLFGEANESVRIGRFVPLRRLGAGGMGVVYRAYDEQLRREVAVKLLSRPDPSASERLLREAQALARVTNPHVVTIYDVGVSAGQVFIAMELIVGIHLRDWLTQRPRTIDEIMAVFRQAGQGLWAMHRLGIAHCDFKPENVMVGADGRARIVDFGLARWAERPADSSVADAKPEELQAAPPAERAPSGAGGTPAYMAPEQHLGQRADARSDQWSFCVALYEALYGAHPFAADNAPAMAYAAMTGALRDAPPGRKVPEWLRQVVLRGMRQEPEARWPSVKVLLAELSRDRSRLRRRALGAAGLLVLTAASVLVGRGLQRPQRAPCLDGEARIAEVWGPGPAAALAPVLGAGGAGGAGAGAQLVARLDGYAAAWAAQYREACLAHARGEQSSELADLRMHCLEERRSALRASVQVLGGGAGEAARREVVAGLAPLAACADVAALRSMVPLPLDPRRRAEIARLREALAGVEAEERAGRYEDAARAAGRALQASEATGYEPLIAEALFQRGAQESRLGRYEEAARALEQAFARGLASRHDELAGQAANLLLYVRGHRQAQLAVAGTWERVAEALLQRHPEQRRMAVDFYGNRGLLRSLAGAYPEALADYQRALALTEAVFGARHLKYARVLGNIAQVHAAQQQHAQARAYHERALAIREEILGPDHPVVAASLSALGSALKGLGEYAAAAAALRRALAIEEAALSPEHPDRVKAVQALGEVLLLQARSEEAARVGQQASSGRAPRSRWSARP